MKKAGFGNWDKELQYTYPSLFTIGWDPGPENIVNNEFIFFEKSSQIS